MTVANHNNAFGASCMKNWCEKISKLAREKTEHCIHALNLEEKCHLTNINRYSPKMYAELVIRYVSQIAAITGVVFSRFADIYNNLILYICFNIFVRDHF